MIGKHLMEILEVNNIKYLDLNRGLWDLSEWIPQKKLDKLLSKTDTIFILALCYQVTKEGRRNF